jgi:hypothetical protein
MSVLESKAVFLGRARHMGVGIDTCLNDVHVS